MTTKTKISQYKINDSIIYKFVYDKDKRKY